VIRGRGERPEPPPEPEKLSHYGSVHLQEYVEMTDGRMTKVITGMVSIKEAVDSIGLKPSRTESNWFAEIGGATSVVYIPGCQVRAISTHGSRMLMAGDVYVVP
jgi:hypothetical protein